MAVLQQGGARQSMETDNRQHIVIVEDDREISDLVAGFLETHGMRTTVVRDGVGLDAALADGRVDLAVIDVMLPGEDGLAICRRLRAVSRLPIVMLTALGSETDRVVGLELGADDYLTKPFSPRELLARLRAVLRRSAAAAPEPARKPVLRFDGWRLDLAKRHLAAPDGAQVRLTSVTFDLLVVFCQNPRQVLSRERLLDLTHGGTRLDRSIDIQVSRLRRKIEANPQAPSLIKTVRSGGYFFTAEVVAVDGADAG